MDNYWTWFFVNVFLSGMYKLPQNLTLLPTPFYSTTTLGTYIICGRDFIYPRTGRMHWEVGSPLKSVLWTHSGEELWLWLQLKRGMETILS